MRSRGLVGLAMHVLDAGKHEGTPATLGQIYRFLNADGGIQWNAHQAAQKDWTDPEARRLLNAFVFMTEKERSFVKTSLAKALNLWANPLVDAATSASDFDLRQLRRRRMTIYLGANPDTMGVLGPVIGLFFQQTISTLTRAEPGKDEPHKVLMLMDEFPAMGKMDLVADAVATIRSYGGRMAFVIQGLSQLADNRLYGQEGAQTILQNCDYQTVLGARDDRTTAYVVKRLGKKTVRSTSRTRTAQGWSGSSRSVSDQGRDLMMFQEVQQMPETDSIVLVGNHRPVKARKIRYYDDKAFTPRLVPPPEVPEVIAKRRNGPQVIIEAERPTEPSEAARAFAEGKPVTGQMEPPSRDDDGSSAETGSSDSDIAPAVASTLGAIDTLMKISDPSVAGEQDQLRAIAAKFNAASPDEHSATV